MCEAVAPDVQQHPALLHVWGTQHAQRILDAVLPARPLGRGDEALLLPHPQGEGQGLSVGGLQHLFHAGHPRLQLCDALLQFRLRVCG